MAGGVARPNERRQPLPKPVPAPGETVNRCRFSGLNLNGPRRFRTGQASDNPYYREKPIVASSDQSTGSPSRCVLHVINGEHYSGAERVQDLLAARLPEFRYHVAFACVKPREFAARRHYQQAPVFNVSMHNRIDMRPAWHLRSIIRQTGAVLLHAHTPRSLMVARLAAVTTGLPVVYHVHSPTSRDTTKALRNWLNNATERFSLTGVDRMITVSNSLHQHMAAQGYRAERLVTVPNGVPVADPLPARSVPRGPWTLGSVALFRPRKGLEVLLQTLAQLVHKGHPVRLRAVGPFESAEYEASIHELAAQLDVEQHIDWIGFTQNVPAELAMMDLFVLPSLFGEGLPMVVLEAMAHGLPVVATRVEGIPEAIREGQDGMLAQPNDAGDLATAVESVLSDPTAWLSMTRNVVERHAQQFSDIRMAEQVADVYRQLLDDANCNRARNDESVGDRSR